MNNNNIDMKVNNFKLMIENGKKQIPKIQNEQQTKNVLVEPFFNILDINTYDLDKIKGEYLTERKFADYQIFANNKPIICIECKSIEKTLNEKHIEQLGGYVISTHSIMGILTNGIKWMFFGTKENGEMNKEPFRTIDDITKLNKEEIKEIVEKYNYEAVTNNIYYIKEIIQLKQENQKLKKEKEIKEQTTFKVTKEEKTIKRKGINLKKISAGHRCITSKEYDRDKKILFNQVVNAIDFEFSNIVYDPKKKNDKQPKHHDNLRIKDTDIIIGSISPAYKGIRMYINVEEIDDPDNLVTDKTIKGEKIKPKGTSKHGYGQYAYTINNEKDIEYGIFLLKQSYQKNNSY